MLKQTQRCSYFVCVVWQSFCCCAFSSSGQFSYCTNKAVSKSVTLYNIPMCTINILCTISHLYPHHTPKLPQTWYYMLIECICFYAFVNITYASNFIALISAEGNRSNIFWEIEKKTMYLINIRNINIMLHNVCLIILCPFLFIYYLFFCYLIFITVIDMNVLFSNNNK